MLIDKNLKKSNARQRRHWLIRKKVSGTVEKPRLVIFRSLRHTYAQLIDDTSAKGSNTLLSYSTKLLSDNNAKKTEQSYNLGLQLGSIALEKGIKTICFDRAGYKYHGRIKAVAEGARKAGLVF